MNTKEIGNELYFFVVNEFVTKKLKINNAIELVKYCMELVDKKNITGPQKSEIVKIIIDKLTFHYFDGLKESLSEDCIANLNTLTKNNLLQPIMDTIYSAAKGRTDISNLSSAQMMSQNRLYNIELRNWNAKLMGF